MALSCWQANVDLDRVRRAELDEDYGLEFRRDVKHASVGPEIRILVIEDDRSDVFLLDRALKKQDLRFQRVRTAGHAH
jgi:hypothetical protein